MINLNSDEQFRKYYMIMYWKKTKNRFELKRKVDLFDEGDWLSELQLLPTEVGRFLGCDGVFCTKSKQHLNGSSKFVNGIQTMININGKLCLTSDDN